MSRMLLLSHAEVSKAAYDALTLIVGNNSDKISYITLPYGQDLDLYQKAIEVEIQKAKGEGILILTDLFGGSPFMISSRLYGQYYQEVPIEIITGLNLPMVIETANALVNGSDLSELKKIALQAGTEGIVDFTEKLKER